MISSDFLEKNITFSNLRGSRLAEVLEFIENFDLVYRQSLGLDESDFFGTEIEYEGVSRGELDPVVMQLPDWLNEIENSISLGGEIKSCKMNDQWCHWDSLLIVCRKLRRKDTDTRHKAGGHIHVDVNVLPPTVENYRKLVKFLISYEHILLRFGFGDKLSPRTIFYSYARPIAKDLYLKLDRINKARSVHEMVSLLEGFKKNSALCFMRLSKIAHYDQRTFEFRFPNTTDSAVIWQNNINCFVKLLKAIPQMDEAFLDKKIRMNRNKLANKFYYEDVDLLDSLEFADLVFTNNLDKVYFLRQYFKDYEIDYFSEDKPGIAKVFVKE